MQSIIVRPIITEKSMQDAGKGKFSFVVYRFANKPVIKKVIEAAYSVNITKIYTTTTKGNRKRVGKRRTEVKKSPWKKVIVAVKEGQKIDLFDQEG